MKQLVRRTIEQYGMIPSGTRVLCGLSGGADSVSLLLCLHELGYDVCACHLHHGLRGAQADADEAFCRALCARMGVAFVSERCDAAAAAADSGQSFETAARRIRYDFFDRCARTLHAGRIATAHTADDNLETMLFHLIRGTGAAGLSGIPPVRGAVIRPLIAVERRQVETYLTGRGQDWRTDATNLDDSCTRNRIRHHVIPALRAIEPHAARHAVQAAALLRQDNACLDALAQVDGTQVDAGRLCDMPPALAARAVRSMLKQAGAPMGEIGQRHIAAVCALARKRAGSVSLPGQLRASVRAGIVSVQRAPQGREIHLVPDSPTPFGAYTVLFTQKQPDIHGSFKFYPVACDTINLAALTVRTWRPADRITLPGARGARSLKRLYAERGIAPDRRDGLPVLCSGETVVAAAGIGVDSRFCGTTGGFVVSDGGEKRVRRTL